MWYYNQWRIQKIERRAEDNISAPSSFIANAHNDLYAFSTEKGGFLKQILSQQGGGAPTAPLNPPPITIFITTIIYWPLNAQFGHTDRTAELLRSKTVDRKSSSVLARKVFESTMTSRPAPPDAIGGGTLMIDSCQSRHVGGVRLPSSHSSQHLLLLTICRTAHYTAS